MSPLSENMTKYLTPDCCMLYLDYFMTCKTLPALRQFFSPASFACDLLKQGILLTVSYYLHMFNSCGHFNQRLISSFVDFSLEA